MIRKLSQCALCSDSWHEERGDGWRRAGQAGKISSNWAAPKENHFKTVAPKTRGQ